MTNGKQIKRWHQARASSNRCAAIRAKMLKFSVSRETMRTKRLGVLSFDFSGNLISPRVGSFGALKHPANEDQNSVSRQSGDCQHSNTPIRSVRHEIQLAEQNHKNVCASSIENRLQTNYKPIQVINNSNLSQRRFQSRMSDRLGKFMTFNEVADELSRRLANLFRERRFT